MNEIINFNNLSFSNDVIDQLVSKYPEIKDNLELLKLDANPQSKQSIIDFLITKIDSEDYDFLKNLVINNFVPFLEGAGSAPNNYLNNSSLYPTNGESIVPQHYFDNPELFKIHRVEKTPEAWELFIKDIRSKLLFSNFSVVDKGDYLEVYFL
jgi:hypothetical protein